MSQVETWPYNAGILIDLWATHNTDMALDVAAGSDHDINADIAESWGRRLAVKVVREAVRARLTPPISIVL